MTDTGLNLIEMYNILSKNILKHVLMLHNLCFYTCFVCVCVCIL